ncbi:MAG: type II secretion system protein N [Pseudomonadota bacterium]
MFVIINCILLTLAACLLVQTTYQKIGVYGVSQPQEAAGASSTADVDKKMIQGKSFQQQYSIIGSRNLFGVLTEDKTTGAAASANTAKSAKTVKITPLKLNLQGTVMGFSQAHAVIEDQKTKQQDLYMVGDSIQGAYLKAVYKDCVILEYNGEEQRLEMTVEGKTYTGNVPEFPSVSNPQPDETDRSAAPELANQARFKMHSSDNQPDGLLIYGIKPDSVFSRMGLLNNDIIQEINNSPVQVIEEALTLFQAMANENTGQIFISRGGQEKTIVYQVNQGNEE